VKRRCLRQKRPHQSAPSGVQFGQLTSADRAPCESIRWIRFRSDRDARRQQRAFASVSPQPFLASEKAAERERMLSGQEAATTMLSVAAHMGQAKVRGSKPGLACSRSERIIGASQSGQNGRSSVALPWKNEGMERLSIDASLNWAGATLSVTDKCRGGAVMNHHALRVRESVVSIAH
jgi:hypothetical protein